MFFCLKAYSVNQNVKCIYKVVLNSIVELSLNLAEFTELYFVVRTWEV